MHQIIALHRRLERAGQADGGGVVDKNINPAEGPGRLGHCRLDQLLLAHIDDKRQGLAARRLDLLRRGVDGAGQLGMGLSGFGRNHHIGAIGSGPLADSEADPPACTGNKEGLSLKISHRISPLFC